MATTVADLLVRITGDASGAQKAARDTKASFKELADGVTRDVNGRLRDSLGRFVKESESGASTVSTALKKMGFDVSGVTGIFQSFSSGIGTVRTGLNNFASQIGVVGSILGASVAGGIYQVIDAASDLNESISKVNVVFGDSAHIVQDFAQTAATSMGISRQEALESAGTFGNLFTTMGLGHDTSAQMSVDLVKLAGDLASFNNASPEEMLLKLRAGLVGEIEPLRAVGVNMNAATVEAKAMELGLASNAKQLTESDKVLARYKLILEQTGNAQGDFQRTSDGVANQLRIVKAQATDLAAGIGEHLLPVAQKLLGWVGKAMEAFRSLSPETQKMIATIVGFTGVAAAALPVLAGVAAALSALLSPIGLVIAALGLLVIAYQKNFGGIRDAVDSFVKDVQKFWATHGEEIKRTATEMWESVKVIIEQTLVIVGNIIRAAGKAMNDDWSGAWDELIKTQGLKTEIVKKEGGRLLPTIAGGLLDVAQLLADGIVTLLDAVISYARQLYYFVTLQFDKLSEVSAGFEERLSKRFQLLRGNVQNTWIGMLHGMKSDLDASAPGFERSAERIGQGITNGLARTVRLPNLTLPGFGAEKGRPGLPGFDKQLEGQAKAQIEAQVKLWEAGGQKSGKAFGKGVGGGAKGALKDANKEILSELNDFLKDAGSKIGTVSERVYKSLTESARKGLTETARFHKETKDAIQAFALEIKFAGDGIEEKIERVRAAMRNILLPAVKNTTIEAVSHIKELGATYEFLPRMLEGTIPAILKGHAEYNQKLRDAVTEAGKIRQKEVDDARTTAESILRDQKELYQDLEDIVGRGMAAIIRLFGDGMTKTLARSKDVAEGILQIIGNVPGRVGDKLRDITRTILDWVNSIDGILRGLHKIFDQIPNGLGEALKSLGGIFKKKEYSEGAKALGQQFADAFGVASSAASSGATRIVGALTSIAGAAAAFAGARGAGVAGGAISGALGAVSALGGIAAIFKASFAPLLAGPWGIAAVGIGALVGGLLGRKSAAQKEQERLQREQQKLQVEKLKQDLQKGAQEVVQAALTTMRDAMKTLEQLADFTRVPKETIRAFFANLNQLLKNFVEMSGRFGKDLLDKAKSFAEAMQPGVELIGAAVSALSVMLTYVPVAETTIDRFFADFTKVTEKFGVLAEVIPNKLEKQVKKFANRLTPAVALLESAISGLTGLLTFKAIEDASIDAFAVSLEKAINKIGELALRMDKFMVKQAAFFAERAGVVADLLGSAVEGLKSLADFKAVPVAAMDAFVSGFELVLSKLQNLSSAISVEALVQAEMIASRSLVIFEAIKSAVEAFGALRDYKGVASEAIEALSIDFQSAVTWLTVFVGFGDKIAELASEFRDSMVEAGEALKTGLEYLKDIAQLSAAALAGITSFQASGGGHTIGIDPLGLSPDFLSSSSGTSGTTIVDQRSIVIGGVTYGGHGGSLTEEQSRRLDELMELLGIGQAAVAT